MSLSLSPDSRHFVSGACDASAKVLLRYDYIMTTLWLHYDYIMTILWLYYDYIMTILWLYYDYTTYTIISYIYIIVALINWLTIYIKSINI